MANGNSNQENERREDATDARTLEDIEHEEKTNESPSNAPALSPDNGSGGAAGDDAGNPM